MPVVLGRRTEHGFDEPLGLMTDCHRRIEHFLGILVRVVEECRGRALPDEHRRAAEASLKYFDIAAPRHTEDEERTLFPRLRKLNQPGLNEALVKLGELEADHRVASAMHTQVRSGFQCWLASGSLPDAEAQKLAETLAALQALYGRHIEVEEREVFPLASTVLSQDQLVQVGKEMTDRRGVSPVTGSNAGASVPL
jgi:hemerythrin-like domain-containing protein